MPFLTPNVIEKLGAKFQERDGNAIIFPATPAGEQRNLVIWPRRFFGLLEGLTGPEGGKRLSPLRGTAGARATLRLGVSEPGV